MEQRWGYDGHRHYPSRRVAVVPHAIIIQTLHLDLEDKGALLSIFGRYWSAEEGPTLERFRLEHRISKKRAGAIVGRLISHGLVSVKGDRLVPGMSFGSDPYADEKADEKVTKRSKRDMPSDWQEIREAVFERDGYACFYCGSGRELHCDHVHPVILGGDHTMQNLVTACASCNLSKGPKTLREWRPDLYEAFVRTRADD